MCISSANGDYLRKPGHSTLHGAQRVAAHLAELLAGVVIHLFDGATGKDVVKLIQEHRLPRAIKRHARCLRARGIAGHASARARQRLAKPQHAFRAAIGFFDPCLTGVGATVQLQIELAIPDLDVLAITPHRALRLVQVLTERMHALLLHTRQTITACADVGALNLLCGWPAATIAITERLQVHRNARTVLFHQVLHAVLKLLGLDRAVVVVPRGEVRENLCAIKPAPTKGDVREFIRLAPAHLVGDECVEPCLRHDLRQAGWKSKCIGQVQESLRRGDPKARLPIRAPMQNLPYETFT